MLTKINIFKVLLGIFLGSIAFLGGAILIEEIVWMITINHKPHLPFLLLALGYVYFLIGLVRLKKWALVIFALIFGPTTAVFLWLLFFGDMRNSTALAPFLLVNGLSMLVLPASLLLVIVRKIKNYFLRKRGY